jgi:aromatic-L-amino-acid decarboxylase
MLRFKAGRDQVLTDLASQVGQIWSGFDVARDSEPELGEESKTLLAMGLPETGIGESQSISDSLSLLDQSTAQSRPRFFAYIGSSGLEIGAIADFLASSYDINLAVDSGAASTLEKQTAAWVGDFVGYKNAKGLFASGGTISNITALAAARTTAQPSSRKSGITAPLAIYCSKEAHYSNVRAVELLGLGADSIRAIDIDEQRKMRIDALEAAIEADLAAGVTPMAIIASAGTTLTGAVDPLRKIAELARKHNIWMHVDGAYGAPAAGTKKVGDLFDGLDLADSVTIDAHKWLFVPKACSILLVKDLRNLYDTFNHDEAYMPHDSEDYNPVDLTLEYSRPLRALKMWMGFYAHGAEEFRAAITGNLDLAQLTYERAKADPKFRVMPNPPQLSIVPIQYLPDGVSDISAHNKALCLEIVKDGRIYISPAVIDGEVWLRPCYTNFRTSESDVEIMFDVIEELSAKLLA